MSTVRQLNTFTLLAGGYETPAMGQDARSIDDRVRRCRAFAEATRRSRASARNRPPRAAPPPVDRHLRESLCGAWSSIRREPELEARGKSRREHAGDEGAV
jgi:hypothetical protein